MKRQELKNLLRSIKPDGDISDIVDQIMELNGADIENAKKNAGVDTQTLSAENEDLKAKLKAYEKGGEKYIDPAEIERLKKFETDTKTAQKRATAENAVSEMLTRNKVLPGVIKLMLKNLDADSVKLGADGKVTKEYEEAYMSAFKSECPDGFVTVAEGTGAPAHGGTSGGGKSGPVIKQTLSDIIAEKRKI